jgi:hypothetical protein
MTRTKLIYSDTMFVAICIIMYTTDGFKKSMSLMAFLIIFIFAGCVIRHINYYKLNKKIY